MRNLLMSLALIAVPVSGFAVVEAMTTSPPSQTTAQKQATQGLGDLSAYEAIVVDTRKHVASGNLAAAEQRITDLETLWDDNAQQLRKADRRAWSTIDAAADATFSALRASTPDPAKASDALARLLDTLKSPHPTVGTQAIAMVAGVPVTDDTGRPLPCEDMIGMLRDHLGSTTPAPEVSDLQSKALERCNADDDARADAFAARALSLVK